MSEQEESDSEFVARLRQHQNLGGNRHLGNIKQCDLARLCDLAEATAQARAEAERLRQQLVSEQRFCDSCKAEEVAFPDAAAALARRERLERIERAAQRYLDSETQHPDERHNARYMLQQALAVEGRKGE